LLRIALIREASDLAEERVRQSFENVNDRNYDARLKAVALMFITALSASTPRVARRATVMPGLHRRRGRLNFRRRT